MVKKKLKEVMEELVKAEPKAHIYAWSSSNNTRIKKAEDMPPFSRCKQFFGRLFLPKEGQGTSLYINLRFGHENPVEEIRRDMGTWMRDNNHGLYHKMLQVEESAKIGWFLYSIRQMDAGALADEIALIIGVQVGLRWKTVDIGVKGKIPD